MSIFQFHTHAKYIPLVPEIQSMNPYVQYLFCFIRSTLQPKYGVKFTNFFLNKKHTGRRQ